MKRFFLFLMMMVLGIGTKAVTITDTIFNRYEHEDFAFGADVSFVPMMESWGTKWLDKNGKQKDILQILKEQGINNIRLRVWTVSSGASSKQEVVSMCKRAKAMDMGVMIDFHYSDTWADPGSQTIPAAWKDHSVEALAQNVYDHTFDVLSAIKAVGVVPKWVQVGNETKRGMLYPVGQTNQGGAVAFAKFVKSGYDAVKAVDSSMKVIVHLPDGHDNSLYRSIFDGLKKNGADWDIIGLSAYPRWSHLDGPTMITRVMANIKDLKSRYGKPCMVVETGHYPSEAVLGNQYLVGLMDQMIKNNDLGCFYWEPESMGGYDMGAWDEATRKPTVMMDAFLGVKHTEVPWIIRAWMHSPTAEQTIQAEELELKARVQHQRKGRILSVEFHLDQEKVGTYMMDDQATVGTTAIIPFMVKEVSKGLHTAWAKATDINNNTVITDTVNFFYGESALFDKGVVENEKQKGGTMCWDLNMKSPGNYRILFKFSTATPCGTDLLIDGDNITRTYFLKNTDAYKTIDFEIANDGNHVVQLIATSNYGLPDITSMRIFPLDGQPVPELNDVTEVTNLLNVSQDVVEVYSTTGILLYRTNESQLGFSLGNRSSATVVLPKCVGGTPYIVRKQRLK